MIPFIAKFSGSKLSNSTKTHYLRLQEIGGILVFILLITLSCYTYFYQLLPAHKQIQALDKQYYTNLRTEVEKLRNEQNKKEQTAQAVQTTLGKIEKFEQDCLEDINKGHLTFIDELNSLAQKNSVQISDKIVFETAKPELLDPNKTSEGKVNNKALENIVIYPGITAKFNISGQYNSLRKFVNELEENKQFLIPNILVLELNAENKTQRSAPSDLISINLEVTIYFRNKK